MASPNAEQQALHAEAQALKTDLEAHARANGIDPTTYASESYTGPDEDKVRPNMQNMQQLVITFKTDDDAKTWHEANVRDVPSKWRYGSSLRMYYPDPRFERGARSVQAKL